MPSAKTAAPGTPTSANASAKGGSKAASKQAPPSPLDRTIRPGNVVTHTELASTDPAATRKWCEQALGWSFGQSVPTPAGDYHMWRFADQQAGGGIRATTPGEPAGSTPYCEVPEIEPAYRKALAAGATEMVPPSEIPGNMGWIAVVKAPGGVPVGFWAPK